MKIILATYCLLAISCSNTIKDHTTNITDSLPITPTLVSDTLTAITNAKDTLSITPASAAIPIDSIVNFAETLIGIPYKYASTNPVEGFDCSGFITYVFNHFNIQVPRSSVDFTNVGTEISLGEAKRGDLILFTGTDSTIRIVGHMGIITSNNAGEVAFIHSSSGKANGVVITPLNNYYKGRFVKVIRWWQP